MEDETRLNRYISESGFCSRREADRLIEAGQVTVDGRPASVGMKVQKGQKVRVDGRLLGGREDFVYLAVNKPRGIVCTAQKREKNNLMDFLQYPRRVTYLGRLDKDSTGLLLMTNDGELNNRIMRARYGHEKEYVVEVDRPVDGAFLKGMASGVPILGTVTRPCTVTRSGPRQFHIVLTQGLNRQIRRMCEYFGYQVTKLRRIRIMNIELGDLPEGAYRELTPEEVGELRRLAGMEPRSGAEGLRQAAGRRTEQENGRGGRWEKR